MKIIEGFFAGTQIQYKEQKGTRVTSDKVRKAVFDVLKNTIDVEGAKVADLFCGSGMYGIESLSRGAGHCVFVDQDKKAISSLREMLNDLGIKNQESRIKNYKKFIKSCDEKFDLVFADPPYYQFDFEKLNDIFKILSKDGIFVLEQSKRGGAKELKGLELFLEKKYGDTVVNFYKKA